MKYISVSDIHLLHRRTPTEYICTNFRKHVLNKTNVDLDVMFIAGDYFDRLIDASSYELRQALDLIADILKYCYRNHIKLRVLKGTTSHDWEQEHLFVTINKARENPCDLKYVSVLDIEYMENVQKHILYIPDDWSTDHAEVEEQISEKLREHAIDQVDIAILHGQFKYQMLTIPNPPFCYDEEYFLRLVKGFIHIGHFHVRSNFDRIIANGSFDRLSHKEEGAKGYARVDGDEWKFVDNPDAYIYKTIELTKRDTYKTLDKKILALPERSYVRLTMKRDHEFNLSFKDLVTRYHKYYLDKKITEDVVDNQQTTHILTGVDFTNNYEALTGNIKATVITNINAKNTLSDLENARLNTLLSIFEGSEFKEEEVC